MKLKRIALTILTFGLLFNQLLAQKFLTQTAEIKFFSKAPLENIEAINNQVMSVIDLENNALAFSMLMKAFVFEKALMQEHFNEKYVESDLFPKASFKGNILNLNQADLNAKPQEVLVKGILTIHGEANEVETTAFLSKTTENQIIGKTIFTINLDDYKIKIPSAVKDNINKTIEITVNATYEIME